MEQKYIDSSDEQLIAAFREGDAEVMDYLMEKYKNLVRKRANALYLIGGETEDLIQEGMIGLFKAVRDYREDKDASFASFAELCVTRQMYTAVEASRRKKHTPLNTYIPLDVSSHDQKDGLYQEIEQKLISPNPETIFIDLETQRQFFFRLQKQLSKMEQQVLAFYLDGLNYHQIAERMDKPAKSIDNALQRIRGKVKNVKGYNG